MSKPYFIRKGGTVCFTSKGYKRSSACIQFHATESTSLEYSQCRTAVLNLYDVTENFDIVDGKTTANWSYKQDRRYD